MDKKCLTFALMDAPFESARTATAFRLLHAALDRGHDVNVFAYEGAVGLAFARQTAHPNATHGRDAEQESHPLPRVWIGDCRRSPNGAARGCSGSTAACASTSAASPRRSAASSAARPPTSGAWPRPRTTRW